MSFAWRMVVRSGSRGLLGAGVAVLRRDPDRLSAGVFLTPEFVLDRGGLLGVVIVVGKAGGLVDVPGLRMVLGGVTSAPVPRIGVVFGAIVIRVVSTQRLAILSCVKQFRGIKQASVVEHLPRWRRQKRTARDTFCFRGTSYTGKLYSLENYSKRQLVAPGDAGLCYEIPMGAHQNQNACFAIKEKKVMTRTELPTAQNPFPVGSLNHLRVSQL